MRREACVEQGLIAACQDLEQLFAGLKAQFRPIDAWQVARDKLARLVQHTSVASYIEEFLALMLCIPDMTEQDRVDRFVRGLKIGPRKEVMVRRCQTLDEAMAVADRTDAVFYAARSWNRPTGMGGGATGNDGGNGGTAGGDESTPMELGQARLEFQGTCFTCGAWGHRSMDCPWRARAAGRGRGRGYGNQRPGNPN